MFVVNSIKSRNIAVQCNTIANSTIVSKVWFCSNSELTIDTTNLNLTGELWGVFGVYLCKNESARSRVYCTY